MEHKFYKVLKDTFLWDKDAIISDTFARNIGGQGYVAINSIFNKEHIGNEYISAEIIENNPEWFERVYPINLLSKTVFKGKEEAKEFLLKQYKE